MKPNNTIPSYDNVDTSCLDSKLILSTRLLNAIDQYLESVIRRKLAPNQKYEKPIITSQDYGWEADRPVRRLSRSSSPEERIVSVVSQTQASYPNHQTLQAYSLSWIFLDDRFESNKL